MTVQYLTDTVLLPSIFTGLFIGGFVFFLGLGINLCLKLFNS